MSYPIYLYSAISVGLGMTPLLKKNGKIDFLRAKARLIVDVASNDQGRTQLATLFAWVDKWPEHASSIPADAVRRADELLEGVVEALKPEIRRDLEQKLLGQFGVTRLGKPPKSVDGIIRKVLETGRIATDNDAELVYEFVAKTSNIELIGMKAYQQLAGTLDRYQCTARRSK